jgi:hypothetical protein
MIKAQDIIKSISSSLNESTLSERINLFVETVGVLDFWSAAMKENNRVEDLVTFIRANYSISQVSYSGPAYRFYWLKPDDVVRSGAASDFKTAADIKSIDSKQLIDYLYKNTKAKYISWAKSLKGIGSEIGKQLDKSTKNWCYIFKSMSSVKGIDLSRVASAAESLYKTLLRDEEFKRRASNDLKFVIQSLPIIREDLETSEEILAPIHTNLELIEIDPLLSDLK